MADGRRVTALRHRFDRIVAKLDVAVTATDDELLRNADNLEGLAAPKKKKTRKKAK